MGPGGRRRILGLALLTMALVLVVLVGLRTLWPTLHPGGTSAAPHRTATCVGESCTLGPGVRDVQLFVEPGADAKPVTSAIAAAVHSVWVEVYLLTDARVIAALEDATRRGVDVRVMLEEHPYGFDVVSPQRTLQTLTTAGIQAKFASSALLLLVPLASGNGPSPCGVWNSSSQWVPSGRGSLVR